jgi:hypothetical protein
VIIHGDARDVLAGLDENSIDAMVTDPPAGISFMGKDWDHDHGGRDGWIKAFGACFAECLRVLKPGAHALVWALPRTSHWTATALEDAGFEIRDRVSHFFGSGFPKSKNLDGDWQGWGSALKPSVEDWWLCRKPLSEKNVAANVLKWGTGALNIDGTRVNVETIKGASLAINTHLREGVRRSGTFGGSQNEREDYCVPSGRWPANLVLSHAPGCRKVGTKMVKGDGHWHNERGPNAVYSGDTSGGNPEQRQAESETVESWDCCSCCPVRMLDEQSGEVRSAGLYPSDGGKPSTVTWANRGQGQLYDDKGGASRFFATFEPGEPLFFDRATAIFKAWNPDFASIVGETSDPTKESAASVLSRAVTVASHGAIQLSDCRGLSTNATPKELKTLCVSVIVATLHFANVLSQGRLPAEPTPCPDHASYVVRRKPTGTTTITISRVKSAGYAASATSTDTSKSTVAGAAASQSRFRYCAKPSKRERNMGGVDNRHPTVKAVKLMQYLCRLVTPPGGTVLDPFMGSGSTGIAAIREGFEFIGIEREAEYLELARQRIESEAPLLRCSNETEDEE